MGTTSRMAKIFTRVIHWTRIHAGMDADPFRVAAHACRQSEALQYSKVFPQKPAYKNQGYPNSASGASFSFNVSRKTIKNIAQNR